MDLIDRQAAIGTVKKHYRAYDNDLLELITFDIERLPSAQPEKRTEERTETHACDCISRQAAIDAMCWACGHDCDKSKFVYNAPQDEQVIMCPEHYAISTMPPAQPEIIYCKDCDWWTKQDDSIQGRCALMGMYPTGGWYCGNARRRTDG